ncbi:MAG TPA: hypothetical protein VGJ26_17260 [Pirellulales bacterium]
MCSKPFFRAFSGALIIALVFTCGDSFVQAEEWGNLKGRFVFEGPLPVPAKVDTTKEPLCKAHDVHEEKLIVDKDNKGIKDVVIFCRTKEVKVKPELLKDAKGEVVLDNKGCRFEPHVLPILITQTLVVKNSDPFSHNSKITEPGGKEANPNLVPGAQATYKYAKATERLTPVECSIHSWMKALVVPRDNPYFAVSKADGSFEIKDLPAGKKLDFGVLQEKAGNFKDDKSNGWTNGRFEVMIKPGDNDLGVIKLNAKVFNK